MIWTLNRSDRNPHRTIGTLEIPGLPIIHTLEDVDRGLFKGMPLEILKSKKVFAKTAIPVGEYEVVINYSNRFQKMLPLLIDVPGFEGIRIHPGNTAEHTEGCILVGLGRSFDSITQSRSAMARVMPAIMSVLKREKLFIKIT